MPLPTPLRRLFVATTVAVVCGVAFVLQRAILVVVISKCGFNNLCGFFDLPLLICAVCGGFLYALLALPSGFRGSAASLVDFRAQQLCNHALNIVALWSLVSLLSVVSDMVECWFAFAAPTQMYPITDEDLQNNVLVAYTSQIAFPVMLSCACGCSGFLKSHTLARNGYGWSICSLAVGFLNVTLLLAYLLTVVNTL